MGDAGPAGDEGLQGGSESMAGRDGSVDVGEGGAAGSEQAAQGSGKGGTMTKGQLRELAQRRGLSYEALLADAATKGVVLPEE